MKLDLKNLPKDTAFLHQLITDLVYANERLQEQLRLLKAKRFGKSSEKLNKQSNGALEEKLDKQIADLELYLEESESSSLLASLLIGDDETETEGGDQTTTQEKGKPKRKPLSENLERTNVILNPSNKCPECGGTDFHKISDDISETLEYIPSSFKVIRYVRPRCSCKLCETIVQAFPADKTIAKGKAGPGLLSHIIIQKYCNHLPLYRQSQIYEREGIELSRSTMASWAGQCSRLLEPLIKAIQKSVFEGSQIHGDDTTVKVLAPGTGKTITGRIWTYVRDGRPHGDKATPPAVCYFYSPDRKGERPREHLKDFKGILHADAYSGYDKLYTNTSTNSKKLYKKGKNDKGQRQGSNTELELELESQTTPPASPITEAACWAHTRRKFYEVTVASDKASIAISSIEQIAKIYEIEDQIRGESPDTRLTKRQELSKALVDNLFIFMQKALKLLPNKSATANAINYALNNQDALMRFLSNGKIEIDNNAAERSMRVIALGRKNWLFAGSDRGGETAANMYTIIETAKLNNIEPWAYLTYVLTNIQNHNSQKIAELLPWNVKLN